MAGASSGFGDFRRISPRLVGRHGETLVEKPEKSSGFISARTPGTAFFIRQRREIKLHIGLRRLRARAIEAAALINAER